MQGLPRNEPIGGWGCRMREACVSAAGPGFDFYAGIVYFAAGLRWRGEVL
jgi:hypothetical protein